MPTHPKLKEFLIFSYWEGEQRYVEAYPTANRRPIEWILDAPQPRDIVWAPSRTNARRQAFDKWLATKGHWGSFNKLPVSPIHERLRRQF